MLKKIQKIYEDNKDIKYSWMDKNGDIHEHISDGYIRKFRMQTPEEILKSRIGNCWETVELTRYFLEKENIPHKTYFFGIPMQNFYCHSIIVAEINDKYYWIENSFKNNKGIHEFKDLTTLFNDVLNKFPQIVGSNKVKYSQMKIHEYEKPAPHLGCVDFYFYCMRQKSLTKKYLPDYLNLIEDKN